MDTPKCIAAGHDIPIFTAKAYQGRNRRLQLIPNAGIFIAPACTDGPVPGLQLRLEKSDQFPIERGYLMKKQVFNPYLPSYEYVPDGEPHVFGERLYLYGSHDRFDAAVFCLNDYVCWSAPVDDLTQWRYEGVIYRKDQDPVNQNIPADAPPQRLLFDIQPKKPSDLNPRGIHALYAPDVVQGPDERYYLYYCLDFLSEIGVAVFDTPCGAYEYLGRVRHADGTPLGARQEDLTQFDPGVFVDEGQTGLSLFEKRTHAP